MTEGLLQILQRGFAESRMRPIGILLPAPDEPDGAPARWEKGRFINPTGVKWEDHCSALRGWADLRGATVFDEACRREDCRRALEAEKRGEPVIYLCYGGMVDCAVPITLNGRTTAVLFTGQLRPARGKVWSADLIESVALESSVADSADAWAACEGRNRCIMATMREQRAQEQPPELVALAAKATEIQPQEVPNLLGILRDASQQLSLLAETTLGHERERIRAHFTSQVAKLLAVPDMDFWTGFSDALGQLSSFLCVDYACFYMLQRENDVRLRRFAWAPDHLSGQLPREIDVSLEFTGPRVESGKPIRLGASDIDRHPFVGSSPLWAPCYVVPLRAKGPLGIAVFGWRPPKAQDVRLCASSLVFLQQLFSEIAILIEHRRELQGRDMYVTDIAHEVRSPVAAALAAAENLSTGRITDPERVKEGMSRVISRLRRLQMAIERLMMLEELLEGSKQLASKAVPVYNVAVECKREYDDWAAERSIKIEVDKELGGLPSPRADRDAFKHALGNLVSNAIKYGDPGTTVMIEGRLVGREVKVDVEDVGIAVPPEALPQLGQRHFRTRDARRRDPSGTGIGLTLVARFLKLVAGRLEVKSEPLPSGRHLVVFSMYLPR